MATLADSLVTTIKAEWGNGGGGGGQPAKVEAHADVPTEYAPTTEQIIVRLPVHVTRRPINDSYANVKHSVLIRVKTTTSDTRLYEIVDELRWIINNVAVTGITRQFCSGGEDKTDSSRQIFIYDMRVTCEEHMASSAASYAAGSATTFEVDELTVNTSITGLGLTITDFLDEDDMASDSAAALASQQSIKKYVDDQILTEDTIAELNDTTIAGLADNHILTYDNGTSKWINEAQTALTGVDHDAITNFDANEHVDHTAVTLTAGAGLTGTGDITASRTFAVGAGTGITVNADTIETDDANIDHDALNNFTANEHFLKTEVGLDDLDDCSTLTGALLLDALMYGSANAAWVPLAFGGSNNGATVEWSNWGGYFRNDGADDLNINFTLAGIPFTKGALTLTVTDVRMDINDADAGDKVDRIRVWVDGVSKLDDATGWQAAAQVDLSITNCTPAEGFHVYLDCTNADQGDLKLNVLAKCYYS